MAYRSFRCYVFGCSVLQHGSGGVMARYHFDTLSLGAPRSGRIRLQSTQPKRRRCARSKGLPCHDSAWVYAMAIGVGPVRSGSAAWRIFDCARRWCLVTVLWSLMHHYVAPQAKAGRKYSMPRQPDRTEGYTAVPWLPPESAAV